jgi:iron complex outermembrane receptor protein
VFVLSITVFARSNFIRTVVDKGTPQPLPGVIVQIFGTKISAVTDFGVTFKFTDVKTGSKVVFSYVGYENVTVTYSGQNDFRVTMAENFSKLSEVIIKVGYGTARNQDLTGSTTTVTTKDFNKGANVTSENLLNGRVAGLTTNTVM